MTIRRLILPGALCLAAMPAAAQPPGGDAWRTDVPCAAGPRPALTVADTAVETQVPGCVRAHCITLPEGRRACTCTGDTTIVVRMDSAGRMLHEWPADYGMAGGPGSLRAMQVDLDGDGRAETVVREWMDMSNGLGIRYYRLSIFDGRDPARMPAVVAVDDFEPGGSFVRRGRGGGCELIATRWTQLRDPRRAEGTYFTGQWMRYRDGRLEHVADRPLVARRLLHSFADARFTTRGAPFAHLRHRDAQARPGVDPWGLPPYAGRRTGTIRGMTRDTLDVALASGETVRYVLGVSYGATDGVTSAWLVDGATDRTYPREYAPSDRAWLDGTRVTVDSYATGDGQTVHLLIIHPRTQ